MVVDPLVMSQEEAAGVRVGVLIACLLTLRWGEASQNSFLLVDEGVPPGEMAEVGVQGNRLDLADEGMGDST